MEDRNKDSELCDAAAAGDLQKVTKLLNEGADVNSHVVGGVTALMKASTNGHLEVVKLLVEKGANVNLTDRFGYNALLWAIDKRIADLNTIKYLVEHHCNVNMKTKEIGYTPLHWVAQNGDLDKVKYLVEHGARVDEKTKKGETPVHLAAAAGHADVLDYFIDQKHINFDVFEAAEKDYTKAVRYFVERKKKAATSYDRSGWSILHRAAHGGSLETVKYLIDEKRVPVNANNRRLIIPLHEAAGMGHTQVAVYLVEKGADVNSKDPVGRTPLYWAADNGRLDIVKFFVEVEKANVFQIDNEGNTLLHAAEWKGSLDVVKYLLEEMGLDVNARDNEGNTPLLETIRNGKLQVFHYLLEERNADFELADNQDKTCLHEAAIRGYMDEVKMLVDRGADINAKDRNGRTPLYFAADGTESGGHLDVVQYFIEEKKANAFQRDNYGNTLLHAAEWNGALDVVKYLVEKQGLDVNAKDNDGNTPLGETKQRGKVEITKYLESKNARASRRRRRNAPSPDIVPTLVNSAYRHYSVINRVSNYALNIASGCLASSSEPFLKAGSAIKSISDLDLLGGFLMLLNVGCRKVFHIEAIQPYVYSESVSLLSPPQLVALRIDPNATTAVGESFRYETEF